ncbi:hypothetical protein DICVIV_13879 [Dictyocaulus viviparus]|uniref:Uncharacterized protein n=1 Tax=Dictyocaulus viviparus TaxID=29172 RepID=A0A0D8X8W9_DICVI|nr:hypothetical protein DICVIV_13879 [Dictyocaulus viviparus]
MLIVKKINPLTIEFERILSNSPLLYQRDDRVDFYTLRPIDFMERSMFEQVIHSIQLAQRAANVEQAKLTLNMLGKAGGPEELVDCAVAKLTLNMLGKAGGLEELVDCAVVDRLILYEHICRIMKQN